MTAIIINSYKTQIKRLKNKRANEAQKKLDRKRKRQNRCLQTVNKHAEPPRIIKHNKSIQSVNINSNTGEAAGEINCSRCPGIPERKNVDLASTTQNLRA